MSLLTHLLIVTLMLLIYPQYPILHWSLWWDSQASRPSGHQWQDYLIIFTEEVLIYSQKWFWSHPTSPLHTSFIILFLCLCQVSFPLISWGFYVFISVKNLPKEEFRPIIPPPQLTYHSQSYHHHPPPASLPAPSYKQFWSYFPLGIVTPLNIEAGIRKASRDVEHDGRGLHHQGELEGEGN